MSSRVPGYINRSSCRRDLIGAIGLCVLHPDRVRLKRVGVGADAGKGVKVIHFYTKCVYFFVQVILKLELY